MELASFYGLVRILEINASGGGLANEILHLSKSLTE